MSQFLQPCWSMETFGEGVNMILGLNYYNKSNVHNSGSSFGWGKWFLSILSLLEKRWSILNLYEGYYQSAKPNMHSFPGLPSWTVICMIHGVWQNLCNTEYKLNIWWTLNLISGPIRGWSTCAQGVGFSFFFCKKHTCFSR